MYGSPDPSTATYSSTIPTKARRTRWSSMIKMGKNISAFELRIACAEAQGPREYSRSYGTGRGSMAQHFVA